jgi:hypothetical protein
MYGSGKDKLTYGPHSTDAPRTGLDGIDATITGGDPQTSTDIGSDLVECTYLHKFTFRESNK